MSEDDFAERYQKAANLAEVVAEVTDSLLDLTDVPNGRRARIVARPIAHKMPPLEIRKRLIQLDQSDLSDKDVVIAKRALIDAQF